MKKLLTLSIIAIAIFSTTFTGCVKTSGTSTTTTGPNVGGFVISKATSFIAGLPSNITVSAIGLSSGTYTVNFSLSAPNAGTNLTATLTMSGGTGTFSTGVLYTSGSTTITVNSITDATNATSTLSGCTYTLPVGSVSWTENGTTYTSDLATASLAGSLLNIQGVIWNPLTAVNLYIDSFANTAMTVNFDATGFSGSAHYSLSSMYGGTAQIAAYGIITITSVSPLITGTYSFTDPDSTHFTNGKFSVVHP